MTFAIGPALFDEIGRSSARSISLRKRRDVRARARDVLSEGSVKASDRASRSSNSASFERHSYQPSASWIACSSTGDRHLLVRREVRVIIAAIAERTVLGWKLHELDLE